MWYGEYMSGLRAVLSMRRSLLLGSCASVALFCVPARAQDKGACLDASSKGQILRNTHTLVEARDQLQICAQQGCPGVVQSDCATWLAQVESEIPTVIVSAKNGAGAELIDVKVSFDGTPLLNKLDGIAVPVDPGLHAFHFEAADGTARDQTVLVRQGQHDQLVAVVLGSPATAPGAIASTPRLAAPAAPAPAASVTPPATEASDHGSSSARCWLGRRRRRRRRARRRHHLRRHRHRRQEQRELRQRRLLRCGAP